LKRWIDRRGGDNEFGLGEKNGRDETAERCYFHFMGEQKGKVTESGVFSVGDGQEMNKFGFFSGIT